MTRARSRRPQQPSMIELGMVLFLLTSLPALLPLLIHAMPTIIHAAFHGTIFDPQWRPTPAR